MPWRFFRRATPAEDPRITAWWRAANAALVDPSAADLTSLRAQLIDPSALDERERQDEMLEGIERVIEWHQRPVLPVLDTQHRVIGTDQCHFMAPVSAPDLGDATGKLFLTAQRVIFAGGASIAWPWHRVRRAGRQERDLIFEGGDALTLRLRCNSYGDAAVAAAVAARLSRR